MSCSPFDLRDYFLEELPDAERGQVESHVRSCPACRQELDRLRVTQATLFTLRDEEIPQRIAFVSDKVFEPSLWRRTWTALWGSGGRLGFVSAAMLSAAILVSALTRPAPIAIHQQAPAAVSEVEIRQRVDAAVAQAVKDVEVKYAERTERLVNDIQRRDTQERNLMMASFDKQFDEKQISYWEKKMLANTRLPYAPAHPMGGQQ